MNADLLFRNYYRPLCLYALHFLDDATQAEDVVQDCFVRLVESDGAQQNARAWLYAAVRNRCIDQLRRQGARAAVVTLGGDSAEAVCDDDAELCERAGREALLWEAIDRLPDRQRQVLLMAKRDGMTYAQIADALGIAVKTVEHQLGRALKKVRAAVGH